MHKRCVVYGRQRVESFVTIVVKFNLLFLIAVVPVGGVQPKPAAELLLPITNSETEDVTHELINWNNYPLYS